jgi:hypothetical protein
MTAEAIKEILEGLKVPQFLARVSQEFKVPRDTVERVFVEASGDQLADLSIGYPETEKVVLDKTSPCQWPMASGARKGQPCGKSSVMGTSRCKDHTGKEAGVRNTRANNHCMAVLEFGARSGEECGNELHDRVNQVCLRHYKEGKRVPRPVPATADEDVCCRPRSKKPPRRRDPLSEDEEKEPVLRNPRAMIRSSRFEELLDEVLQISLQEQ